MWHPWRELRSLTGTIMAIDDIPAGDGWWSPRHDVILLRRGLLQVERRCVLAHELGHRALGHNGICDYADADRQDARQELHADRWAARRLIDFHDLARTAAWTRCRTEAADELWVTEHMLSVRMTTLHPAERAELRRRGAHE